jgi:ribosomal protein S27AE
MNRLVQEIIKDLLPEEKKQITALYAGGFKPPTSGHFEVVETALKQNPEIDEFIIFIGSKERNGISQEESLLIWEVYNKYLPFKVKIEPSSAPPVKAVYDFAKNHPTREILWVIGAREGNEDDFKDLSSRTRSITNYPNIEVRTIITKGGVSGTAARNAAKVSFEKFEPFLPSVLTPEEKQEVYQMVSGKIQENVQSLKYVEPNFNVEWEEAVRYPEFEEMGKEGWIQKAKQGLPLKYSQIKSILGNVDLDFDGLEEPKKQRFTSAFQSGTIEMPIAVKFSDNDYDLVAGNTRLAGLIGNGVDPQIWVVDLSNQQLNENASYSQHIDIKQKIKELIKHMLQKGMNITPLPKVVFKHGDTKNAKKFLGKTAYYNPETMEIVLYTEGRHPKDIVRSFSHEMVHHTQNLEGRLGNVSTTNTLEDDHLDKLEQEANLNGTMTFRNWTDSLNENILPQEKFAQETNQNWIETSLNRLPEKDKYDLKNYDVTILPLNKVKPTQFGEDYINASSKYQAEQYKRYIMGKIDVEDLRREDFFPVVVDADTMGILDGNHRHAVHKMLGIPKIKAILVTKKTLDEAIVKDKVICDNCGWSWDLKDGGEKPYLCHKCGYNNFLKLTKETLFEEEDRLMVEVVNPDGEIFEYKESNIKGLFVYRDSHNNLYFARIFFNPIEDNPHFEFKTGWFEDNNISKPKYNPHLPPNTTGIDNLKRRNTVGKIYRDEILPFFKQNQNLSNKLYIKPISHSRHIFSQRLVKNHTSPDFNIEEIGETLIISLPQNENRTKDPFGLNAYAMELARLREEKTEYTIYCDLDGVLVDFDLGYQELTGITSQQADANGVEAFWSPLSKAGAKFWITLKWMSDGKQLWSYIKKYDPILLSAPSREESSRLGKRVWVKRELPDVKLILKSASQKQQYASPTSILIDDRQKNIDQWNAAGGVGILHTSTANTIKQLKQLGL